MFERLLNKTYQLLKPRLKTKSIIFLDGPETSVNCPVDIQTAYLVDFMFI